MIASNSGRGLSLHFGTTGFSSPFSGCCFPPFPEPFQRPRKKAAQQALSMRLMAARRKFAPRERKEKKKISLGKRAADLAALLQLLEEATRAGLGGASPRRGAAGSAPRTSSSSSHGCFAAVRRRPKCGGEPAPGRRALPPERLEQPSPRHA